MNLQEYTFQIISVVLGSAALGSLITVFANRGKTKAEAENVKAETNNLIIEGYKELLDDLRKTVHHQGDQLKVMLEREVELMKIINGQQQTEREHRQQIKALETKLAKRISKLEVTDNGKETY